MGGHVGVQEPAGLQRDARSAAAVDVAHAVVAPGVAGHLAGAAEVGKHSLFLVHVSLK